MRYFILVFVLLLTGCNSNVTQERNRRAVETRRLETSCAALGGYWAGQRMTGPCYAIDSIIPLPPHGLPTNADTTGA